MKRLNNLLSSILNGQRSRKLVVSVPYSRACHEIIDILVHEGYIRGVCSDGTTMKVFLRYYNNTPVICGAHRVSRSSRRVYSSAQDLPKPQQGLGLAIISTTKGFLSDRDARKLRIGGEIMCIIW
uniref:Ribosomal protein S8 n=1 Tax=prasinophyte sp. MBIC10622 TaxID=156113 RepID=A0A650AKZ4_9CHLO|nr:ribosomal protein S8 [prasinophyte sp. MBIC10622]